MARFSESSCYDSAEFYKIDHIYCYDYFKDTLKRTDFVDGSILSKIKKQYSPYRYCFPDHFEEQNNETNNDSIFYMRDEDYDVILKDILFVNESFISDRSGELVATWSAIDSQIFCKNKLNNFYPIPCYKIVKSKKYKLFFKLESSAMGNYIGLKSNGELVIITYSNENKSGIRIIEIDELVTFIGENLISFITMNRS